MPPVTGGEAASLATPTSPGGGIGGPPATFEASAIAPEALLLDL